MTDLARRPELTELLVEAFYCARHGDLSRARRLVHEIRDRDGSMAISEVAVRTMLIEGVCEAYEYSWESARDRMRRAQALAELFKLTDAALASSAWRSFVEFNLNNLEASIDCAAKVFEFKESGLDPITGCRAAVVIASLFQLAGLASRADAWFRLSRKYAERIGDSSLTSAIIFDRAALRLSTERFDRFFESKDERAFDPALTVLFAESSEHFDAGARVGVLLPLHKFHQAQALSMQGRFEESRQAYDIISEYLASCSLAVNAIATIDKLWGDVKSSRSTMSIDLPSIERLLLEISDRDDRAIALMQVADVAESIDEVKLSKFYADRGRDAAAAHLEWRSSFGRYLIDRLGGVEAGLDL